MRRVFHYWNARFQGKNIPDIQKVRKYTLINKPKRLNLHFIVLHNTSRMLEEQQKKQEHVEINDISANHQTTASGMLSV